MNSFHTKIILPGALALAALVLFCSGALLLAAPNQPSRVRMAAVEPVPAKIEMSTFILSSPYLPEYANFYVPGGSAVIGTVTLNASAPVGGIEVIVWPEVTQTSAPVTLSVDRFWIKAGQKSGTFTIQTQTVEKDRVVHIYARLNNGTTNIRSAGMGVTAAPAGSTLNAITVSSASIVGGTNSVGTVTLTGPAPAGGQVIQFGIEPNNATIPIRVAATVTVKEGATTETFPIQTRAVTTPVTFTISAWMKGIEAFKKTVPVTVIPPPPVPTVSTISFLPTSAVYGTRVVGKVTLNTPAPVGGKAVSFSVVSRSASNAKDTGNPLVFPTGLTIKAGEASSEFDVQLLPVIDVVRVTFAAVLSEEMSRGQYVAKRKTTVLTVRPSPRTISKISISPATVVGGKTSVGTVTLSGPALTGGQAVLLTAIWNTSLNPLTSIPKQITVPAGKTSATFSIVTKKASPVVPVNVTITATANASQKSAVLKIN